ncbi:MAG: TIGR00730 family Rossman fold protein [Propionibacteriaceae bacterium]|jgi:uncharacterized protein (TIGR00730 family)|nr:TIGR00730 family Rossman fold protein [Propionibacteriaceae bacterium]
MADKRKRFFSGATVRRGAAQQTRWEDAELLRGPTDTIWRAEDPWRVLRIQSELVEGFETLQDLGPAVSLFGSARTSPDNPLFAIATEVGRLLAEMGVATITGAGPGIMEAGNQGADEAGGVSVGLGIELPEEDSMNDFVNLGINFRYFFVRKVMFLKYASGFIGFPGGFGTMDEIFETLTLAQTGKIAHYPIALIGSDYWGSLWEWVKNVCLEQGYISPDDVNLVHITDDAADAVQWATRLIRSRDNTKA